MLGAACSSPHVRAPIEEEPFVLSPGPPPSVREALEHPLSAAGGGRTPIQRVGAQRRVPLVHGTIAGRGTMLLLDTGAYDHLLEGWFAHELADAEASGKTAAVIDHANRTVAMDRWSEVSLALDGWGPLGTIRPLATRDATMGPFTLGIGGIVSPQKLNPGGAVVLDFPGGEMVAEDLAHAEARLGGHRVSLGTAIRCGTAYILTGSIEGKEARLIVDTGAAATDLKATSAPGRALTGRSAVARDMVAVGGAVTSRLISDATVILGQLKVRIDVPLVSDRAAMMRCASDGVVGMDVLASCVVVIEPNEMRIACD